MMLNVISAGVSLFIGRPMDLPGQLLRNVPLERIQERGPTWFAT